MTRLALLLILAGCGGHATVHWEQTEGFRESTKYGVSYTFPVRMP